MADEPPKAQASGGSCGEWDSDLDDVDLVDGGASDDSGSGEPSGESAGLRARASSRVQGDATSNED